MVSVLADIESIWTNFKYVIIPSTVTTCEALQKKDLTMKLKAIKDPKQVIEDEMDKLPLLGNNGGLLNRDMLKTRIHELLPTLKTIKEKNTRNVGVCLFYDLLDKAWNRYQLLINDPITQAGQYWQRYQADEKREYNGSQRYLNQITIQTAFATKLWCTVMETRIKEDPMNLEFMALFEWYSISSYAKSERYVSDGNYRYIPSQIQKIEQKLITQQLKTISEDSINLVDRYGTFYNNVHHHLTNLIQTESKCMNELYSTESIAKIKSIHVKVYQSNQTIKERHTTLLHESLRDGLLLPTIQWESQIRQLWTPVRTLFIQMMHNIREKKHDVHNLIVINVVKHELNKKYIEGYETVLKEIESKLQEHVEDYKCGSISDEFIKEYSDAILMNIYHTRRIELLKDVLVSVFDIQTELSSFDAVFNQYPDIRKGFVDVYLKQVYERLRIQLVSHKDAKKHLMKPVDHLTEVRDLEYKRRIYSDAITGLTRLLSKEEDMTLKAMENILIDASTIIELKNGECTQLVNQEINLRFDDTTVAYTALESYLQKDSHASYKDLSDQLYVLMTSVDKVIKNVFPVIESKQQEQLAKSSTRVTTVDTLLSYLSPSSGSSGTGTSSGSGLTIDMLPCVNLDQRVGFIHLLYDEQALGLKQQMDYLSSCDWLNVSAHILQDIDTIKKLHSKMSSNTNICTLREIWTVVIASWRVLIYSLTFTNSSPSPQQSSSSVEIEEHNE